MDSESDSVLDGMGSPMNDTDSEKVLMETAAVTKSVDSCVVQPDSQLSMSTEATAVDQAATTAAHESGN